MKYTTENIKYYLDIADVVSNASTCLRKRYGAIIVNKDKVVSVGYNGAPNGKESCTQKKECIRDKLGIPSGERYEMCCAVHAEANAIILANWLEMQGATMFLVGRDAHSGDIIDSISPCCPCKRLLINSGIEQVIIRNDKNNFSVIKITDL